ncbi:MAG: UvrB/UvrC motif-containing protein [Elusimicrobiota bacterium]
MLCDQCHKREAKIFVKKEESGNTVEYNICEICAVQTVGRVFDLSAIKDDLFSGLSDMLAGFSDIENGTEKKMQCTLCGFRFADFQNTGKLGCEGCYTEFEEELLPLMKRLQGSTQHAGKGIKGLEAMLEIEKLKTELQAAVEMEEYERAAVLRDKIRETSSKKKEL